VDRAVAAAAAGHVAVAENQAAADRNNLI